MVRQGGERAGPGPDGGFRPVIDGIVWAVRHPGPRRLTLRLLIALALYATAVILRLLLDSVAPGHMPFITFFPAIALAAFYCGLWPLAALLLALAVTGSLWVRPAGLDPLVFRVTAGLLFAAPAIAVGGVVLYMRSVYGRLALREAQIALVNRELKHRLRNLLALISSICAQTVSSAPPAAAAAAITGRLQAVAAALDLLDIPATVGSDLGTLVAAVVAPIAPGPDLFTAAGPAVRIPVDSTTAFALILHELATNAVKHGPWAPGRSGRVDIAWSLPDPGRLHFVWRETGGGPGAPAAGQGGFGTVLITRALGAATVTHEIRPGGAWCEVILPV